MTADFLITGGTGTLGRRLVPRLREAGAKLRVLSRKPGADTVVGDLTTGEGVEADGIRTIVHCAGTAKGDDRKAEILVRAAKSAGVRHIVQIQREEVRALARLQRPDVVAAEDLGSAPGSDLQRVTCRHPLGGT